VAWFFLLLAPTSSFLPIADLLVEHRVYLASWGLFLALVLGADRLLDRVAPGRRTLVAATVLGAAFCVLAVATYRRNAVWESELAFWRDVVEKSPGKARPRQGLGTVLVRHGDLAGGVAEFSAGLARVPQEATALRVALLHNLGAAYANLGRVPEACATWRAALLLPPAGNDHASAREGRAILACPP
jgi:hypothetical protein